MSKELENYRYFHITEISKEEFLKLNLNPYEFCNQMGVRGCKTLEDGTAVSYILRDKEKEPYQHIKLSLTYTEIQSASLSEAEETFKRIIDDDYWNVACDKYPFNGYDDIEDTPTDKHYRQLATDYAKEMKQKDIKLLEQTLQKYKGLEEKIRKIIKRTFPNDVVEGMKQIKFLLKE